MSNTKIARIYLLSTSPLSKQIEEFITIPNLTIEPKATLQWYKDIKGMVLETATYLTPFVSKAKALEEESKAKPEDLELKTKVQEAGEEIQKLLNEQITLNIVRLFVQVRDASLLSIYQLSILKSLHDVEIINCDLFGE